MAPPNNASCLSDLNLNTASCLIPATLDNLEIPGNNMGSPNKRKPDPAIQTCNKSAKRAKKSKKDIQMTIRMEIEELDALEKENKELEEEEMGLKKKLQDMRDVYMDFIKNGQIVFVENPPSASSTTTSSPKLKESLHLAHFPQLTAQYQTGGQVIPESATHDIATPPTTPEELVFDSMLENSIPSISVHSTGYSEDPSSSAVQYYEVPVIQCTTDSISRQWVAPPTPENGVFMTAQPHPYHAMEPDLVNSESFSVMVENIDIESIFCHSAY